MRRREKQVTDPARLEQLLRQGRELQLAMHDGDYPYLLPLNYGYADGCLYVHCARQGKKLDLLRANPKVAFSISGVKRRVEGERACDWSTRFWSLIGTGQVEIIDQREEKIAGYDAIMRQFGGPTGEYLESNLNASLVLKISIEQLSGKESPAEGEA